MSSDARGSARSDLVFQDLAAALADRTSDEQPHDARIDFRRRYRKGVPEVVFAEGKSAEQVREIVTAYLARGERALVSRVGSDLAEVLARSFPDAIVEQRPGSQTLVIAPQGVEAPRDGGTVGIVTAGTSDLPIAREAQVVAEEMGCRVELVADVGVAGLHRLFPPLRRLLDHPVDVMIVVAGMDGALASVVAGLVPVPVIGLPTSVGYGFGGRGEGALMTMLQSCAPGLTVVNIDNAVGAASTAALIANGVARARYAADDRD